jgi:hypothetical protein
VVEALAGLVALAEAGGLVLELLVGERLEVFFERVDRLRIGLELAKGAALADTKDLFEN